MSELKIGFVGLGDQGGPMAEAISDAGFELHVWARRA
jgi:3-hydroxyisobutyrate dehydrogenase-like beta-hydroxyacid dehydrogenase